METFGNKDIDEVSEKIIEIHTSLKCSLGKDILQTRRTVVRSFRTLALANTLVSAERVLRAKSPGKPMGGTNG